MMGTETDALKGAAMSLDANTTLELRARIRGERIEALNDRGEWHFGDDMLSVIRRVMDRYPSLHIRGVGYDPAWGWKWESDRLEKARAEMLDPGSVAEFERALRFLSHAGRRFPALRINKKRSSYSWKHAAERIMGDYVSHGMLIAAAYALGFRVETENSSPNAWINLSEEAITLDPGKGAT